MVIYGKEFAELYDENWACYGGAAIWPFLKTLLPADQEHARTWLDLCCGTGRLLGFVMEEGFSATGIDLSRTCSHTPERMLPARNCCEATSAICPCPGGSM